MQPRQLKKNKPYKTLAILAALIAGSIPAKTTATESLFNRAKGGLQSMIDSLYGGGESVTVNEGTWIATLITIINFIISFIGVIFFGLLLYGGYLWMIARGNETELEKAKKITRETTVGLLIIILARILTEFILNAVAGLPTT